MNRWICAAIPARYKSSRLEGKPLLKIAGQSIIQRVYQQVAKSAYIERIFVLTDDERIADEIRALGGDVIIVTEECLNGTERICRALPQIPAHYRLIVNIQGDEPFIDPANIDFMIKKHLEKNTRPVDANMVCTTIHTNLTTEEEIRSPAIGKMVLNCHDDVLYCSRNVIPVGKKGEICPGHQYIGHIGAFVFERDFLEKYLAMPDTPLQLCEDIEWLKIMEMGYRMKSYLITKNYEIGINTMADYQYLLAKYEKK